LALSAAGGVVVLSTTPPGRTSALSPLSSAGAGGARLRRTSTGVERVRAAGADEI
jgi:hypothetical protein